MEEIIKITKKITRSDYDALRKKWRRTKTLDLTLPDLGFYIKGELSPIEKKELEEIYQKINDLCGEETCAEYGDGEYRINGVKIPDELWKRKMELLDKIYADVKMCYPADLEESLQIAKDHNKKLDKPIPKGARMYYDYPLSFVVIGEIQRDIYDTSDIVLAFCQGYQEIYRLEEDSCKVQPAHLPGMMNRNMTDGCFGIWGHDLGDLVLEGIVFHNSGKDITFSIGS